LCDLIAGGAYPDPRRRTYGSIKAMMAFLIVLSREADDLTAAADTRSAALEA
jgi:hypothetical protein